MNVEIYQGTYVTAESATNYIDVATIQTGCDEITKAGDLFETIGTNLKTVSTELNADALSINGKTMQEPLEEVANFIKNVKADLEVINSEINSALIKALDKKQIELNNIAKQQDAEMINSENAS